MKTGRLGACALNFAIAVMLLGCGRGEPPQPSQSATEQSATSQADELKAREQQLAQREAELQAKEAEQERLRQAEIETQQQAAAAASEAAAKQAAAKTAAAKKAAQAKPASAPVASASTPAAPLPAIEVPSGTQLLVTLAAELSTKTAKVGDSFATQLVSELTSSGHVVAPAGARVMGTITEVVSGSKSIGAVPALGLRFDQLELADGRLIAIRGDLQQQGDSEKGRDTAKIVGGAAAGAVIGHQIKPGTKGKVIGGVLGGAAGAIVAKNTGTEVKLPAGTQLPVVLSEGFVASSH